MARTVDVSGLTDEAVHAVEAYVMALQAGPISVQPPPPRVETAEEWVARLKGWTDSRPKRNIVIDDSRETIYGGRGE